MAWGCALRKRGRVCRCIVRVRRVACVCVVRVEGRAPSAATARGGARHDRLTRTPGCGPRGGGRIEPNGSAPCDSLRGLDYSMNIARVSCPWLRFGVIFIPNFNSEHQIEFLLWFRVLWALSSCTIAARAHAALPAQVQEPSPRPRSVAACLTGRVPPRSRGPACPGSFR